MKFFLLLFLIGNVFANAQVPLVQKGHYPAGFTSFTTYDSSRAAVAEQAEKNKGRMLQLNVWYPAESGGRKMTFADYVHLAGLELDSSRSNNFRQTGIDRYFGWPASLKADKNKFLNYINQSFSANGYNNAQRIQQSFPLVMLVHGFAADYVYLAEFLASHGFIVLNVPVKGSAKYELDYDGKGLDYQVMDYEFARNIIDKQFQLVPGKSAVIGFSFGGQSSLALALRNTNISSAISLDGGIGSAFGAQQLKNLPYYKREALTIPILHLYNPHDQYTDVSWLKSLANVQLVPLKNMEHGYFTSFGVIQKFVPKIMGENAPNPGNGYSAIMLLVHHFLNSTLITKKDTASLVNEQRAKHPWLAECIGE